MAATTMPSAGDGPGIKEIFEDINVSVRGFLESHTGIVGVRLESRGPLPLRELEAWERRNTPFLLPPDLKSFFLLTDGLQLTWQIKLPSGPVPMGCMNMNRLTQITPLTLSAFNVVATTQDPFAAVVFDIDASCASGNVALCYFPDNPAPQVWFRDMACGWHFIAHSFTDYFRLLIMHLGIPSWHYAFTDIGLDPVSQQWFRFISPERLSIDLENASRQGTAAEPAALKRPRSRQQLNLTVMNGPPARGAKPVKRAPRPSEPTAASDTSAADRDKRGPARRPASAAPRGGALTGAKR